MENIFEMEGQIYNLKVNIDFFIKNPSFLLSFKGIYFQF